MAWLALDEDRRWELVSRCPDEDALSSVGVVRHELDEDEWVDELGEWDEPALWCAGLRDSDFMPFWAKLLLVAFKSQEKM